MAEAIVKGMEQVEGVQAKAFSIDAVDADWATESNCLVFGSPVYYATISAEMKTWLDTCAGKLKLAGKLCGAFSTANYVHGGGSCGKPVIHLGPQAVATELETYRELFETYGARMAAQAVKLFA